jgi:hypothetical protein
MVVVVWVVVVGAVVVGVVVGAAVVVSCPWHNAMAPIRRNRTAAVVLISCILYKI